MENFKRISLEIPVRFRDIDAMGHVNNAVFFTYFEEGRKVFIGKLLGIVEPSDYYFILARIECEYLRAVTLSNEVLLETWIGHIGEKSFTFKYAVLDRKDHSIVYARGESVQVFFDYKLGKTCVATVDFIEKVSSYVEK
ncbi:acyl-CoA thioesterase [Thermodesulfobacteriota bacterium]